MKRFNNEDYRFPLFEKTVGIIGHGGGTKELMEYHREPVLDVFWNALSYPVEMNVISLNDKDKTGIMIPVKNVRKAEESIFPIQE